MAPSKTTKLSVSSREVDGSRSARRLRRTGRVPGVIYGGDGDPVAFDVDARELRHALAAAGAVVELSVDGEGSTPVVLKDAQRDPVRGETVHVDLLRVGSTWRSTRWSRSTSPASRKRPASRRAASSSTSPAR